jgi:hypothetical protein
MPSTLNSDNGVSSGTSGLKSTGGNDGILTFQSSGTETMRIDTSGNLGLGVTPSTWYSGITAIQMSASSLYNFSASGNRQTQLINNAYLNASASFIYQNTDHATRYAQTIGQHQWYTAASGTAGNAITFTQAMTLDSSGRLLVGTTSTYDFNGQANLVVAGTANNATVIIASTAEGYVSFADGTSGTDRYVGRITYNHTNNYMAFDTNAAERARITSGGYFKASNNGTYIGSASPYHEFSSNDASNGIAIVESTSASYTSYALFVGAARNTTNNTFYAIAYYNRGAAAYKFLVADSGNVTNTNGSYGTISDAKMKTNIVDAGSQWGDIKALRFRKFKMKDDPSGIVQLGVVAQEVEQVSPGLVEEHTDRDADGNDLGTTTKSVKTSVLLMKAAVALQEAMARIEQLEAKVEAQAAEIAALKAKV